MSGVGSRVNLSGKPRICSEKHDILYSKARFVSNQRHIKRPWFNMNPFLEKTDETENLENFLPEESKYVKHLESLVLCESFDTDQPLDTKEVSIDAFFEYIYSDEWKVGCSVRVLEGQVLDELLLGLYRLENKGRTVRHTTYAIANNERARTGCYKLANKEAYGSIEETILLEFSYFAKLTKAKPNTITIDPFEYLPRGNLSDLEEEIQLPVITSKGKQKRGRAMSLASETTRFRSMNLTLPSEMMQENIPVRQRRGSIMTKPLNVIRFMSAMQHDKTKRQSLAITPSSGMKLNTEFKDLCDHRRESTVHHQSTEKATKGRRNTVDCSRFSPPKMKKLAEQNYSPEFDDDFDDVPVPFIKGPNETDPTPEPENRDMFFGEELYLSDMKKKHGLKLVTAKTILQKKKVELQERRQNLKHEIEEQRKWVESIRQPQLTPLDKLQFKTVKHETIRMPEHVPTFEEFIKLLKEDDFYDPRYRNKLRLKGRRIAQRYYMAKGKHRSSIFHSPGEIPEEIKAIGNAGKFGQQRIVGGMKNKVIEDQESDVDLLPKLTDSNTSKSKCKLSTTNLVNLTASELRHLRQKHSMDVLGVTDSEPCKDHYYKESGSSHVRTDTDRSTEGAEQQQKDGKDGGSFVSRSGSIDERTTDGAQGQKLGSLANIRGSLDSVPLKFPKITPDDYSSSSSLSSSSDESSEISEDEGAFDTRKLNIRYSVERLKRKRRSKVQKKKPAFIEVLAKYYNMHNILSCFRKTSATSKEQPKLKGFGAVAKVFGRRPTLDAKQKKQKEAVVGKLKHFKFQDTRKPRKKLSLDKVSRGDFTGPDRVKFHAQLKHALDDFVVRREIVVSNIQTFYNATTSVTFTKFECFKHSHSHSK